MTNATLVGYHGRRNLGDDIFLRIGCELLESVGVKKVYVAGYAEHVPSSIEGLDIQVKGFENRNAISARYVWVQAFFHMLRSRVLLLCAGSILTIQPFFLAYVLILLAKLLNPKLRVVGLGLSVGPFMSEFDKLWCGRLLSLFDCILLRDAQSYALAKELGAGGRSELAYDIAISWQRKIGGHLANGGECIGVSLNERALLEADSDKGGGLVDRVAESIASLSSGSSRISVKVLSVCADEVDGDEDVSCRVVSRLTELGVEARLVSYDGKRPDRFVGEISTCSAVVTSRMHTGVLAMMSGVPVFQISYAPKIDEFYSRCGLGGEFLYRPDAVTREDISGFLQGVRAGGQEIIAAHRLARLGQVAEALEAALLSVRRLLGRAQQE